MWSKQLKNARPTLRIGRRAGPTLRQNFGTNFGTNFGILEVNNHYQWAVANCGSSTDETNCNLAGALKIELMDIA